MKAVSGILAALALASLPGCLPPPCSGGGDYHRETREISLRLVSSRDSFSIRYEREGYPIADVPVREIRNDALGDTVICRFFGFEGWYADRRHANSVTVDSAGIRISHQPLEADRVDYRDSARTIQVLEKTACDPVGPEFDADSISIEKAGTKRIVFDTLTRRE
jgi:hypothetical protein